MTNDPDKIWIMSDRDAWLFARPRACLAVLLALIPWQGSGQKPPSPPPVTIANTERRALKSHVNGIEYQIDVALPRGYATSQKRYPVVYTLDGNVFFPVLAASYRLTASIIPDELIVVGVGYYPSEEFGFWSTPYQENRARDYTTSPAKPAGGVSARAGGAPLFLRFLREELIPFIDSSYRTAPGDRGLMGHSYGGLFVAYVLTHDPGLFQKYALGSPSLWWDNEAPLRWESDYAGKHKELRARVYAYAGALEGEDAMKGPVRRFWEALKSRHYAGLDLMDFTIVPDEIHTSVVLGSMEHALRSLYSRASVSLPVETLSRYTGDWKAGTQPAWAIRQDGGRLYVEIPSYPDGPLAGRAPERREIFAESEASFFSKLGDLSIVFTLDPDKRLAAEMKVALPRFGYTSTLQRATMPDAMPKAK
jgi:predicted alpha/beta superfamily hydrolase